MNTLSEIETRARADYQHFTLADNGDIENVGARMQAKLQAITPALPAFDGLDVLDVGCDMGFWSFLAANQGAHSVVGIDRGRPIKGLGRVDLVQLNRDAVARVPSLEACRFYEMSVGEDWRTFGRFDLIFCMSLYHHIYQNCGGHHTPIWLWLRMQCSDDGVVIWEGPTSANDDVMRMNIDPALHANYTLDKILAAAEPYFDVTHIGPAIHSATRSVYRFDAKPVLPAVYSGACQPGAGGASRAFLHNDEERMDEIEKALGSRPIPGSLNATLDASFAWDDHYLRAKIRDVTDRGKGLDSQWAPRWCRFYPVRVNNVDAWAMRFEGEVYALRFIELIAPTRLRDVIFNELFITQRV